MKSYAISFFPFRSDKIKGTWIMRNCKNKSHAIRCLLKKRKRRGEFETQIISVREVIKNV